MTADAKAQKISIGFQSGQVLVARVMPEALARLRGALGQSGWHELDAEDGTIVLDLARVDYLLVDHDEHRVGF
jgi:hypothetical protein